MHTTKYEDLSLKEKRIMKNTGQWIYYPPEISTIQSYNLIGINQRASKLF